MIVKIDVYALKNSGSLLHFSLDHRNLILDYGEREVVRVNIQILVGEIDAVVGWKVREKVKGAAELSVFIL